MTNHTNQPAKEVLLQYRSFGQLTHEYQSHDGLVATASTPVVRYAYADGTARHIRRLSTMYPGGREIRLSYGTSGSADDALGRVHEIRDLSDNGQALARYTRRGISATMRIEYPQTGPSSPLELTYIKQAGESNGPAEKTKVRRKLPVELRTFLHVVKI